MRPAPQIRYCTTSDGVSIAYYTMGEGHPLVITSPVQWSHLRAQLVPLVSWQRLHPENELSP